MRLSNCQICILVLFATITTSPLSAQLPTPVVVDEDSPTVAEPSDEAQESIDTQPPAGQTPEPVLDALNFDPPTTDIPSFDAANMTSTLGATRGSYSAVPNMIGDLFNGGSTTLSVAGSTRTNVTFNTPVSYANGVGQIANANQTTATLVSQDGIAGILNPRQVYSVNQYSFATQSFRVEGTGAINMNDKVQAVVPVSTDAIFLDVNRALRLEFPDLIGNANAEDFVTIDFVPDGSNLQLNAAHDQVLSAVYNYKVSVILPIRPVPAKSLVVTLLRKTAAPFRVTVYSSIITFFIALEFRLYQVR